MLGHGKHSHEQVPHMRVVEEELVLQDALGWAVIRAVLAGHVPHGCRGRVVHKCLHSIFMTHAVLLLKIEQDLLRNYCEEWVTKEGK